MHGLEDSIVTFVTSTYAAGGYAAVILLMALESCCIPIPSEVILPLAGFLVAQGKFTFAEALAAGTIGGLIGSCVAYAIGALGGRPLMMRYGRYVLISEADAARADLFFAKHGDATTFFSRLLPVIRTFISLPAGITRMNFGKFVLYTVTGSIIWNVALIYAGELLGQNWLRVREVLQRFDYLFAALILAAIAWYIYRHLQRRAASTA